MLDSELTNNGIDDNDGAGHGRNGAASRDTAVERQAEPATMPAAVPAVLFQAPQVLFQAPQPAPAYSPGREGAAAGTASSSGNGSAAADADDESGRGAGWGRGE